MARDADEMEGDGLEGLYDKRARPRAPRASDEGFVISNHATTIRVMPDGWATFDISRDARIEVALDGLVRLPPDAYHARSVLRGERTQKLPSGCLVVHRSYAIRKGWCAP